MESNGSLKMNIKYCENLWDLWRFVIEKLSKGEYSWIIKIIILESIGSLKMNIKDCENLWDLWMIETFDIHE